MRRRPGAWATGLLLAALVVGPSRAAGERPAAANPLEAPAKPGKTDRCPVCGMFVAPYEEWVASAHFSDGTVVYFDGAKDLFKFLADVPRFAHGRDAATVTATFVTDYYDVEAIDAQTARYVIGSDVRGPMGHELIAHRDQAAAEEFLLDHHGSEIIGADEVGAAVLKGLDP